MTKYNAHSIPVGRWSIVLSAGTWGGFYFAPYRVCLGWIAITWLPVEIDEVIGGWLGWTNIQEKLLK